MATPVGQRPASRRGRRRTASGPDARESILRAAREVFVEAGYDAASIRGIARRAGVDPALVHHYFEDKAELFVQTVDAPVRPDLIVQRVLAGPRDQVGDSLVRAVLVNLEHPKVRDHAVGLVRTALGHDFAARMLRQFLVREVFEKIAAALGVEDGKLRATLTASQVVGLMVVRYGIRAEPLASASHDEVARRVGPVVQFHLVGFPEPLTSAGSAGA